MYNDPKRYKTREHIRTEMIREIARVWHYDESDLAVESFDPLVGMLLGAFATGLEGVYHEMDNSSARITTRLAELLTPDVLTGPRPAHGVMKASILDPSYEVSPDQPFNCNTQGKEFSFSSVGHYTLYNAKPISLIVQSRIKDLAAPPKELFMNEAIHSNEVWLGISLDNDIKDFDNLIFFFDWRNEPKRQAYIDTLADIRMYTDSSEELFLTPGLVSSVEEYQPTDNTDPIQRIERMTERLYKQNFVSLSSRNRQSAQYITIKTKKYPDAVKSLLSPEELSKYFVQDLFWVNIKFPGSITPDVLSKMIVDLNAFPVMNRKVVNQTYELRPLFNVFPIKLEDNSQFLGMIDVETSLATKIKNAQQFNADLSNQYLLRHRGVTRFDERDASQILSYLVDLLRDESAVFMAIGQSEINTDIDEIRKRLERITNTIKKDSLPNWFITVKSVEKSGRINIKYWSTKSEEANNIPFGTKLARDRSNIAFTDDLSFITTTLGGVAPLQPDEYLPIFKSAILSRSRLVTVEDFKAACFSELGDKLKAVNVRKGFIISPLTKEGLSQAIEVELIPNPKSAQPLDAWNEYSRQILCHLEAHSSGFIPFKVTVNS